MIGKNIYDLRKSRGLSLTELSERSSISKSYLSNIERNLNKNPSIQILEKIASVLKVEVKSLINSEKPQDTIQQLDYEWMDFIEELKEYGIEKDKLREYRQLIDFINWKSQKRLAKK